MLTAAPAKAATNTANATAPIRIGGVDLLCDWAGCLYWPEEETLIVSDLHLEKGSSFARKGQFLPPYDTLETLERLDGRIAFWQPRLVIALGDSFHDSKVGECMHSHPLVHLQQMVARQDWIWISGNHDPDPPRSLGGDCCDEVAMGPLTFRHEPKPHAANEICGHLHPQAGIHRRGKTVRRRCFAHDGNRLVLPAFGAYTGGLNIRHRAFAGLFVEEKLNACVMGQERIYMIGGADLI